jgi:uracil-DNA glycosylase family 4
VAADDRDAGAGAGTSDRRRALRALVGQVRTNLALRGRSGLLGMPARPSRRRGAAPALPATATTATPATPATTAAAAARLVAVRDEIGDCRRCGLCSGRNNIVFGVGNPAAHLVFVGEAPGADEDMRGEPFVGKAGQLLTKMIEAMGYRREDVYICNVIKCRPPGNRNPEPAEVAACEPFLKAQLAAIRPRMIVTLGKFAAQCLLRDSTPITRMRGQLRSYEGIPLMPTFHPAFLLRDPSQKKLAWKDLQSVNAALESVGIHPPHPPAA